MKMPIYEYRCQSCGHELEKLQRLSDPVLTDCPDCGKAQLKRLISAAGFRLKGAGWYETDFKQSNQRNLADSASEKSDSGKAKETGAATPSAPGAGGEAKSSGASTTAASSTSGASQSGSKGSSKSEGGSTGKSPSGSTPGAGSAAKTA
jgi:putative FmdB family regulatory protein